MQWLPILFVFSVVSVVLSIPVNELPLQTDGHILDARPSLTSVVGRDPDAIVYPDEITRDSYGNAVTPFSSAVGVGLMTDINKDEQLNTRGSSGGSGVLNETTKTVAGFIIPGYASGIMKVETLLPPNAPIFPLVVPPPKKQEHETRVISNDILPPYRDDEPKIKYPELEVNTQATLFFPDANFFNQISSNSDNNNKVDKKLTTTTTTTTKSPPAIKTPVAPVQTNKKKTSSDIYTGGFGGAPGILGIPQPLGIALIPRIEPPSHPILQGNKPPHHQEGTPILNVNLLPPLQTTASRKPVGAQVN